MPQYTIKLDTGKTLTINAAGQLSDSEIGDIVDQYAAPKVTPNAKALSEAKAAGRGYSPIGRDMKPKYSTSNTSIGVAKPKSRTARTIEGLTSRNPETALNTAFAPIADQFERPMRSLGMLGKVARGTVENVAGQGFNRKDSTPDWTNPKQVGRKKAAVVKNALAIVELIPALNPAGAAAFLASLPKQGLPDPQGKMPALEYGKQIAKAITSKRDLTAFIEEGRGPELLLLAAPFVHGPIKTRMAKAKGTRATSAMAKANVAGDAAIARLNDIAAVQPKPKVGEVHTLPDGSPVEITAVNDTGFAGRTADGKGIKGNFKSLTPGETPVLAPEVAPTTPVGIAPKRQLFLMKLARELKEAYQRRRDNIGYSRIDEMHLDLVEKTLDEVTFRHELTPEELAYVHDRAFNQVRYEEAANISAVPPVTPAPEPYAMTPSEQAAASRAAGQFAGAEFAPGGRQAVAPVVQQAVPAGAGEAIAPPAEAPRAGGEVAMVEQAAWEPRANTSESSLVDAASRQILGLDRPLLLRVSEAIARLDKRIEPGLGEVAEAAQYAHSDGGPLKYLVDADKRTKGMGTADMELAYKAREKELIALDVPYAERGDILSKEFSFADARATDVLKQVLTDYPDLVAPTPAPGGVKAEGAVETEVPVEPAVTGDPWQMGKQEFASKWEKAHLQTRKEAVAELEAQIAGREPQYNMVLGRREYATSADAKLVEQISEMERLSKPLPDWYAPEESGALWMRDVREALADKLPVSQLVIDEFVANGGKLPETLRPSPTPTPAAPVEGAGVKPKETQFGAYRVVERTSKYADYTDENGNLVHKSLPQITYQMELDATKRRHPDAVLSESEPYWVSETNRDGSWSGSTHKTYAEAVEAAKRGQVRQAEMDAAKQARYDAAMNAKSVEKPKPAKQPAARKAKRLPSVESLSDFDPAQDTVVRRNGKTYVVNKGERADYEVQSDAITPQVVENLGKLTDSQLSRMANETKNAAKLSAEGKQERLDAIAKIQADRTPPPTPKPSEAGKGGVVEVDGVIPQARLDTWELKTGDNGLPQWFDGNTGRPVSPEFFRTEQADAWKANINSKSLVEGRATQQRTDAVVDRANAQRKVKEHQVRLRDNKPNIERRLKDADGVALLDREYPAWRTDYPDLAAKYATPKQAPAAKAQGTGKPRTDAELQAIIADIQAAGTKDAARPILEAANLTDAERVRFAELTKQLRESKAETPKQAPAAKAQGTGETFKASNLLTRDELLKEFAIHNAKFLKGGMPREEWNTRSERVSLLRTEGYRRFGIDSLDEAARGFKENRPTTVISKEIRAIQKRIDTIHANSKAPLAESTRAQATTRNANLGKLAESLDALNKELRESEASAPKPSAVSPEAVNPPVKALPDDVAASVARRELIKRKIAEQKEAAKSKKLSTDVEGSMTIDSEMWDALVEETKYVIGKGVKSAEELAAHLKSEYGAGMSRQAKKLWVAANGQANPQREGVSTKNAVTKEIRANAGMTEVYNPSRGNAKDKVAIQAERVMARPSFNADTFVKSLNKEPRTLDPVEDAMLRRIITDRNDAVSKLIAEGKAVDGTPEFKALEEATRASKQVGTTWSEAGRARQTTTADYTLPDWLVEAKKNGLNVDSRLQTDISTTFEKLQQTQAQKTAIEAKLPENTKTVLNKARVPDKVGAAADFSKNKWITQEKADAAWAVIQKYMPGETEGGLKAFGSGMSDELLAALVTRGGAYFERGFRDFADFSSAMVKDVGAWIEPHLQEVYAKIGDERGLATEKKRIAAQLKKANETESALANGEEIPTTATKAKPAPDEELLGMMDELAATRDRIAAMKAAAKPPKEPRTPNTPLTPAERSLAYQEKRAVMLAEAIEARMPLPKREAPIRTNEWVKVHKENSLQLAKLQSLTAPKKSLSLRVFEGIGTGWSAILTPLASFDVGVLNRQGWGMLKDNPKVWARSIGVAKRALLSEADAYTIMAEIENHPRYAEAQTIGKVKDYSLDATEKYHNVDEMSAYQRGLSGLGPVGKIFRPFDRVHAVASNFLRHAAYYDYAEANGSKWNRSMAESYGNDVNVLTKAGNLGSIEALTPVLSRIFISFRKMVGDVGSNFLWLPGEEVMGIKIGTKDPVVRKRMAIKQAKYVAAWVSTAALVDAAAKRHQEENNLDKPAFWMEANPLSPDVGTMRIGNTRYDLTGGERAALKLGVKMGAAVWKVRAGGPGLKYGQDVHDPFVKYLTGKRQPAMNLIAGLWTKKDFMGRDTTRAKVIADNAINWNLQSGFEAMQTDGPAMGVVALMANLTGMSTTSYVSADDLRSLIRANRAADAVKLNQKYKIIDPLKMKKFIIDTRLGKAD